MGLRNIHLLFISMAIALALGFGAWCVWMFRNQGGGGYLVVSAASFAVGIGLAVYGNWFLRKTKEMA